MAKKTKSRVRTPQPQMEVYNSSHAKNLGYSALPSPVTSLYSLIMAGSISGLAYYVGDTWFEGQGMLWSIIAISIMTVIGLVALGIRAKRVKSEQEAQGEGFESALRGSASGWDDSVNDPAEIARLDDMRNNFQKGIQTFREYGKDIYSLPWYVIVGEPGSGKTEAIRRSELRFPDALQDKLQGTGGTYSMHWWFTNQAIIIDTAGAILMQPEAAARFEEFLGLLRTHRPACPINGMILTIPTDSLLADPPSVAEQKARTIAAQLAIIQKVLDVRFPIYLMISKSDRMPGFREFFDAEGQAGFERQMMGWSNPKPLGDPFAPEEIHTAIDTIVQRLQCRALALLADPIPPNPTSRRLDEVDTLYSFPQMLRTLSPRLKLYLDILFQTGTWATKPPFFRGLYFTSALREGAQLDLQLAQALGMPMNQLPPGGFFTREKSVFLRDLFMEKVFPESGLVTRLFDIGAHLRKRLTTFYGATAALLLFALGLAWMVKHKIESELTSDQVLWATANGSWNNGSFLPVVTRSTGYSDEVAQRPAWVWSATDKIKSEKTNLSLLKDVRDRVAKKVSLSWVFSPVPEWQDFLARRQQGYLTLFEGSVMKPVLDAARERILWDTSPIGATTSAETQMRMAKAFEQLLLLETWLGNKKEKNPDEAAWENFFSHLLAYILDPAAPGGQPAGTLAAPAVKSDAVTIAPSLRVKDLAELAAEVYDKKLALNNRSWMSESAPMEESALASAASYIFGVTQQAAESNDQRKADILENKARELDRIKSAEKALLQMSEEKPNGPRDVIEVTGLQPLREAITNYHEIMQITGGVAKVALSMELVTATAACIKEASHSLEDEGPDGLRHAAKLAEKLNASSGSASGEASDSDAAWAAASKRLTEYAKCFEAKKTTQASLSMENMVGNLAAKLREAAAKVRELEGTAPTPTTLEAATKNTDFDKICAYLKKFRGTPLIGDVFRNYHETLLIELGQRLKFPLVSCQTSYEKLHNFQAECAKLKKVEKDMLELATLTDGVFNCEEQSKLLARFDQLQTVFSIKQVLLGGEDGKGGTLRIEMDGVEKAKDSTRQEEVVSPATVGLVPDPSAPKVINMKTISEGFTHLKIMIGGRIEFDGPPSVEKKSFPYDGFESVTATLKKARPAPQAEVEYTFPLSPKWDLLRQAAFGKNQFPIGSSGKSFSISSTPSLPFGQWPKRKDLGLSPEPPSR